MILDNKNRKTKIMSRKKQKSKKQEQRKKNKSTVKSPYS